MIRRFLTWLKDQWVLDEPDPPRRGLEVFCATCAVSEGVVHADWCHRKGVLAGVALLPEGPQLVDYITADQIERELDVQARLPRDQVDARLVEFLLDMRSMVGPTVTGSRMAAGAPVIPGRSS
jgi:hypothetical protein